MTFLLACAIKAAAILVAALSAARLFHARSAALRHWILSAAILSTATVPVLTIVLPGRYLHIGIPLERFVPKQAIATPEQAQPFAAVSYPDDSGSERWALPGSPQRPPLDSLAAGPERGRVAAATPVHAAVRFMSIPWISVAAWLWIAGFGFGLAVLLTGILRLLWIGSRATPLHSGSWPELVREAAAWYGIQRRIRLLQSRDASLLVTWGWWRPTLLLPARAVEWPDERIRVAVYHELAHIRRTDWVVQMLAEIHRAAYWFNPLFWMACNRMVQESEQACDDMALNSGIECSDYAEQLLELTRVLEQPRAVCAALSMARPSTLERRFAAMLNPRLNRRALTRSSWAATAAVFLGITLPIVALRVSAQGAPMAEMRGQTSPLPDALNPPQSPSLPFTTPMQSTAQNPATVEGIVVRIGTSEPLAGITMQLNPANGNSSSRYSALTSADGKFALRNIQPGEYRLFSASPGAYMQSRSALNGGGLPIKLAAGQTRSDVAVEMSPTASISGRVLDTDGEPAGRVMVQALQVRYRNGESSLMIAQSILTNDLGEYRLFWLPPGRYYLSANPQDARRRSSAGVMAPSSGGTRYYTQIMAAPFITRRTLDNGEVRDEAHVPVYFPGTTAMETAKPFDVRGGDDFTGINLTLAPPAPTVHIRGRVMNSVTGKPAAGASLRLVPRDSSPNLPFIPGAADGAGNFDIGAVLPGSYVLLAGGSGDPLFANNPVFGTALLDVRGVDLENVPVVMIPNINLQVQVTIEGPAPTSGGMSLHFMSDPASPGLPPAAPIGSGTPTPNLFVDNNFSTLIRPGDYRVSVFSMGSGVPSVVDEGYLKSVRLGNADVLNGRLHLDRQPDTPLQIVVGTDGGMLEGSVVDEKQRSVAGAAVVLIPATLRQRADLYKSIAADGSGHFILKGIAPGNYRLFAWDDVQDGMWYDAGFIRDYESRAQPIHIDAGSRDSVRVAVIPQPQ